MWDERVWRQTGTTPRTLHGSKRTATLTKQRPTVSVITPAKNAGTWIADTIRSVQAQSFTDWEMIVVDDGSTDDTVEAVHKAAGDDPRIRLEQTTENKGAGGARNTALSLARGRYIAFLDADDLWLPQKLDVQIRAMQENRWAFSWTAYHVQHVDSSGRMRPPPHPTRHAQTRATRRDVLAKKAAIGCLTAVYDTQFFGKVDMPTIRKRQDFVLWTKLMAKAEEQGWATGGIDTPLAVYRHRTDSLSANKWAAARMQWQALTEHCDVGTIDALWLFLSYAARGLVDRLRVAR